MRSGSVRKQESEAGPAGFLERRRLGLLMLPNVRSTMYQALHMFRHMDGHFTLDTSWFLDLSVWMKHTAYSLLCTCYVSYILYLTRQICPFSTRY